MKKLVEAFLLLLISIPKRLYLYKENTICVTIPFSRINEVGGDKWGDKWGDKLLNKSQIKILAEIRNNPNITIPQLAVVCDLGLTTVDRNISKLKEMEYIERIGANKNGYWKVLK